MTFTQNFLLAILGIVIVVLVVQSIKILFFDK